MVSKISNYNIVIIFVLAAVGLFTIKNNVGNMSYQLNEIDKQILQEKNTIHMLKAEIAHLTSPDRLRKLSNNHLRLENIKPNQMIRDPLTSDLETKQASFEANNLVPHLAKHNVKWRYKKNPNSYLKTISSSR